MAYTANATANTYTVSFNGNSGAGGQTGINVTATYNSAMPPINKTAPIRTGYEFMGWYDNEDYTQGTQYYTSAGISARSYNKTSATTLYAGWEAKVLTITLDNQSATTAGTTAIYEKYATGYYLNSTATTQMTTSANGITKPTKTNYTFGGYYTETDGTGTQILDANGNLTSSASTTNFSSNGTLYAKWTLSSCWAEDVEYSYSSRGIKTVQEALDDLYNLLD